MKNKEGRIKHSKYSDADQVILECTKGKKITHIEQTDFPAYRYFILWNNKHLNQAQRDKRRAFRRSIKAKVTASNLLEIAEKNKLFRLSQKILKKRNPRKTVLIKKEMIKKTSMAKIMAEPFPAEIKQLADGSFKIKMDSKTTIEVRAGKDPQEAVRRYRNRNIISSTGNTINP